MRPMTFGKHALINEDGTGLTTEERLERALADPNAPGALKPQQVRAITQNRIRAAMAELAHGQLEKVAGWIQQTAEGIRDSEGRYITRPDPAKAVELFLQSAEYSLPKLKAVQIDVRDGQGEVKTYSIKELEAMAAEHDIVSEQ